MLGECEETRWTVFGSLPLSVVEWVPQLHPIHLLVDLPAAHDNILFEGESMALNESLESSLQTVSPVEGTLRTQQH